MNAAIESDVRWGIIGAGDVCEVKSAPAMDKIEHSKLVAVMRRTTAKAKDYAERHNVPKWYDDADALLEDPDINAIYIATPPNVHARLAQKALAAGKPVYVEKPMADSYENCRKMIQWSDEAKLPLYVAYYRRALPNFLKIKELVDGGMIGEVRTVDIQLYESAEPDLVAKVDNNWRVDPGIAGGGYFYDLASHQLDFLDFLLGPISEATGFSANQGGYYEANDIVSGSFSFESGVQGTGNWCFTAADICDIDNTTIIGSEGQISYPTFGNRVVLNTDKQGQEEFEFDLPAHIQQPLIQLVVDDLLGKVSCPSTGVSGARTNRIMEQLSRP
jgi:predicted dehydrogenase